jgi:hypothetical protein
MNFALNLWNKVFCRMFGLSVILFMTLSGHSWIINKIVLTKNLISIEEYSKIGKNADIKNWTSVTKILQLKKQALDKSVQYLKRGKLLQEMSLSTTPPNLPTICIIGIIFYGSVTERLVHQILFIFLWRCPRVNDSVKGLSSKPSIKLIVAPILCFQSHNIESSNFSYLLFKISLNCAKFQQDWKTLILNTYVNVTLVLKKQHKEFTSDKPIYPLQFEIIFNCLRLSLTFKS